MTDYREIIRLHSLKFSNVAIANSLCCSRNTVSEVLKLAETHSLEWPIPETLANRDIGHLFYPGRGNNEGRRLPDYEYVYNELAKPGVTLSLLWAEYCAKCEAEHTIPYQHSQFNDKYHAYAASKKATLRIKRKPGEIMEVDWVGDTLKHKRLAWKNWCSALCTTVALLAGSCRSINESTTIHRLDSLVWDRKVSATPEIIPPARATLSVPLDSLRKQIGRAHV